MRQLASHQFMLAPGGDSVNASATAARAVVTPASTGIIPPVCFDKVSHQLLLQQAPLLSRHLSTANAAATAKLAGRWQFDPGPACCS